MCVGGIHGRLLEHVQMYNGMEARSFVAPATVDVYDVGSSPKLYRIPEHLLGFVHIPVT